MNQGLKSQQPSQITSPEHSIDETQTESYQQADSTPL